MEPECREGNSGEKKCHWLKRAINSAKDRGGVDLFRKKKNMAQPLKKNDRTIGRNGGAKWGKRETSKRVLKKTNKKKKIYHPVRRSIKKKVKEGRGVRVVAEISSKKQGGSAKDAPNHSTDTERRQKKENKKTKTSFLRVVA